MECQTSTTEEWLFDKESFLAFIDQNTPDGCFICLGKPSRSLNQFSIIVEDGEEHETTDNPRHPS